ncbi:hypothetical protein ACHAPT_009121 [Fusarium lateritium]
MPVNNPPKKMGSFERGQRFTGLTRQAQLYYEQNKKYAESCEESAKKLFEAVSTIATAQGTTWDQVLGLTGDFPNMVFDGGFEYHSPESVDKDLSFAQWFFLSSLVGLGNQHFGSSALFYYVGATLGLTPDSHPLYARMRIGSTLRLARASAFCPWPRGLPWSRLGYFFRPVPRSSGGLCAVAMLGLELLSENYAYNDSTQTIHDVARMRLNACAHATMMKSISDSISKLATKAEEHAKDLQTALSFEIPKDFDAVAQSLITTFDKVPAEAFEKIESYDRIYQKGYLSEDPKLAKRMLDIKKAAPTPLIRLDVSSDFAVDDIWAETAAYDGCRFGGCGGTKVQTFFEDDELITGATWETGALAKDSRKKIIFNLVVTTSKRVLGPYGTGGDKIKADGMKHTFQVPSMMKVSGIIDMAGKFIEHRGDVIMESPSYVAQLRFLVAPAT